MPEYVYALHDFLPENEDEISFGAGEPIEVLEKDDQYNDGWWQGRNLEGTTGLFPQSYTTAVVPIPVNSGPLQPLQELADAASLPGCDTGSQIGVAIGAPASSVDGEVMKATMTDVQKAIEQLGGNDRDGTRSFSFASTRDGDTDDGTETDGEIGVANGGDGWHRSARVKLAQEARKVVEAKAAAEARDTALRSAPPIEVEMSDESEGEDDDSAFQHLQHMHFTREHPHIPEEDEDEGVRNVDPRELARKSSNATSSAILPREDLLNFQDNSKELSTAIEQPAIRASTPSAPSRSPPLDGKRSPSLLPTPTSPNAPLIVSPIPIMPISATQIPLPASPTPSAQGAMLANGAREGREVLSGLPSPALTTGGSQRNSAQAPKNNTTLSAARLSQGALQSPPPEMEAGKRLTSPAEWSVEEVVEWLKSKGFGQDVCDKFIEQEITGDVLLELDINLLKAEIGIVAFGKRMRIANAIADLRRPPLTPLAETQAVTASPIQTPTHSQIQSSAPSIVQTYSYTHSRNGSISQSLNSPSFATSMVAAQAAAAAMPTSVLLSPSGRPESPKPEATAGPVVPKRVSSLSSTGVSLSGASLKGSLRESFEGVGVASALEKATLIGTSGLGLGLPRSGQLASSPSDTALDRHGQGSAEGLRVPTEDDDRGAMSDGEAGSSSKQRRRLFGRSAESPTPGKERVESLSVSKDGASSLTASPKPKRVSSDDTSISSRPSRIRRGAETANKGHERLSLFGASFPSTIGRSRKPPPRISSTILDENGPAEKAEKPSALSFSKLYRKPSARPSTSDGLTNGLRFGGDANDHNKREKGPHEKERFPGSPSEDTFGGKDRGSRDSYSKRSRTLSTSGDVKPVIRAPTTLAPGKSVIEQIGEADHTGWMRKKGDHYNTWKLRYFIIKGPHLYILRSQNRTETKIKGYINVTGYKVIADEKIDPGRYGFRIVHETDKAHCFSSEEQLVVREWMKAIMKATIGRDYSKPVVSSVNIPTIPLAVAQAMNPAPRPPSPTARDAMQKALRRENPNQLSTRDARILMGLPSPDDVEAESQPSHNFGSDPIVLGQAVIDISDNGIAGSNASTPRLSKLAPPRPSRETRRTATVSDGSGLDLINWANSHLPQSLQVVDPTGPLFGGLGILRLAEAVVGKSTSPPVADSAFPSGPNDDKLEGLFRLFDFLLDNDVKVDNVSINDVRQGKKDKVVLVLKALKAWEDRRKDILRSMGHGSAQGNPFMTLGTRR
ncbi:hypothetical protein J3A83DRAFT_4370556 [Scleroderma citrinum]